MIIMLSLIVMLISGSVSGLTLAPLVVKIDPNLNVILTACLTVYVGCYRSVKPTPPSVCLDGPHVVAFILFIYLNF